MKKSNHLKLDKQTIAIIKNQTANPKNPATKADTSITDILQSLVEICTSLTK